MMGDVIAKVGKKQAGVHAVGEYGISSRNARGDKGGEKIIKESIRAPERAFHTR